MNSRPYFNAVRPYTWRDDKGNGVPGVALYNGRPVAHLTPDEARSLADKLHDLADQIDARREQYR